MKILYDIFDLNWESSNPSWNIINKLDPPKMPYLIEGFIRGVYFSFRSLDIRSIFWKKNKHIFLVGSFNHLKTLSKVAKKVPDAELVSYHTYRGKGLKNILEFPFYFIGIIFLPITLINYILPREERLLRWPLARRLERLIVSGPSVFCWEILFRFLKPKSITVSNDHNHWTRSCIKAARRLNIPSVYIPHALTNAGFPPLECLVSFLDSKQQYENYLNKGSEVKIVGAVRYEDDVVANMVDTFKTENILLCLNDLDSNEFIEEIVYKLALVINGVIYVKPHPSDIERDSFFESLADGAKVKFVRREENLAPYIKDSFGVLAGISGVHVDALMCGVLPITTREWYKEDYYGLIEDGVILVLDDVSCLSNEVDKALAQVESKRLELNQHLKDISKKPSDIIAKYYNKLK